MVTGAFTPVARQTLEIVLTPRLHLSRHRPDATGLRTHAEQVEAWQRSEPTDVTAKVVM
jgi:hypothetical protein